ncbi:hypothetical protein Aca07nite_06470 [Actinoplanes capillaceus]|uniref:Uncharacterized protein n=1 Tax=Actinoplanes campanulatus TaxID=113559 RepID=A0ABQ3W8P4_9ACTN|nr:hypothetical protein Aca07nite_06470 [Actinoplanes capillaceus]
MLFRDKPRWIFVRSLNIHQGVTRATRRVVLHIGVSGVSLSHTGSSRPDISFGLGGKSGIDHRAAGTEQDARWSTGSAAAATAATAATGGRGRSAATGHGNGGEQLDGVAVALRAGRRGGGLPHRATDFEGGAAGAATVLITRHPTSVGPLSRGV